MFLGTTAQLLKNIIYMSAISLLCHKKRKKEFIDWEDILWLVGNFSVF